MREFLGWFLKSLLIGVVWVYLLSIHLNGQPLFYYGRSILVHNQLASTIDRELQFFINKIGKIARENFQARSDAQVLDI